MIKRKYYTSLFEETTATVLEHTAEKPLYIVFPPAITTYAFEAAETLSEYIKYLTGIATVRTCEAVLSGEQDAVILGDTQLPENIKALEGLNYGECKITVTKNRFIAASWTDETLPAVVDSVIKNLTYEDGKLSFMCEFPDSRYVLPGYISVLPHYDGGFNAAYRKSSRGCIQIVVGNTNEEQFLSYIDKCKAEDFFEYGTNEVCGNKFVRLTRDDCALYAYFTPYNSTVRIFAEPVYNMHTDEENKLPSVCKPLMTVIGARFSSTNRYLNCDAGSGNMGYVFRLDDGRFILVDGGMELGDYAEKILQTMRDEAVDKDRIVIACWFISHTHIDHTGALLKIAEKYNTEVTVEEIAANFPSISDAEAYREAWNTRRTSEAAYKSFPACRYTKLHTGEVLHFGETAVEVLVTADDLVRQYFSVLNEGITWNTSSMCIRLNIGGNKVILPGDSDETSNGILVSMYGDYLKSDILQVCHHGGWGGTTEVYRCIDPELAIFSTSDELFPKYLQIQYNHDLVYDMHVMETHNNADRCRTFELPYHPSEKRIPPDPKGEFLFTKAKQLEALAQIDNIRKAQTK